MHQNRVDINKFGKYEAGEMTKVEEVSFFQELVNTGMASELPASYGRIATNMIEEGLIREKVDG